MATRSQAREVVIGLLYAYGSGNKEIGKFAEEILAENKIKNTQKDFAMNLFNGVIENFAKIDEKIIAQLKDWDFTKIGDTEKAILRLGVYEITKAEVDKAVIINEAIELAKNFGNENSAKFVNGVLDGIAKKINGV